MSWLDGFSDEAEAINLDNRIQRTDRMPEPGVWQNFGGEFAPGAERALLSTAGAIESGFSSAWQGSLELAASAFLPEPRFGGDVDVTSAERGQQEDLGRGVGEAVKDLKADPRTTGKAGQILNDLIAVGAPAVVAAPFGVPAMAAVVGGSTGYASKQEAMTDGIDEETATYKGAIEGGLNAIGAAIPGAGLAGPVIRDLAAVAGANIGLGVVQRAATAELLEQRGYTAQAAQYRAFDGMAMLADGLLGTAFGTLARAGDIRASVVERFRPTQEQVDAALTQRNAQNYALDTAPGIPTTPEAAMAHRQNMDEAVAMLQRGEPVRLSDSLDESAYLTRRGEHETLGDELAAQRVRLDGEARTDPDLPTRAAETGRAATESAKAASDPVKTGSEGSKPASDQPDNASLEVVAETPVQALARTATETPDTVVNVGEDGSPVYRSLAQAFDEIEVERARMEIDSRAYQAAINCALRWGN